MATALWEVVAAEEEVLELKTHQNQLLALLIGKELQQTAQP
jgi:hypothetical protein